ncbi:alpha/beta fold hydrolase [Demequina sediminicola]|uniref:alpha/beta fold hydrolase n=1 Tax=Demequina sediminicola TaxID=1095026 RepID=UPI0007818DCA|nr:alpha/beta hydrolase [Demequina sediminicola]
MSAPIVFLNAFPVDRAQWEGLLAVLGSDVRGDVITFDMPGIGQMPLTDEDPSLDLIADAAVLAMQEATGEQAAIWVGCSMGGYVAMSVAERHPDAVAGLGLIATKSSADTAEARDKRLRVADAHEGLSAPTDPRAMAEPLIGVEGPSREELLEWVTNNIAQHAGNGIAWGQRAMAERPDRTEVLRNVDAPAVVIAGERDGIIHADDIDVMAEALGVTPVTVDGVGHLVAFEDPEAVASALAPLLR